MTDPDPNLLPGEHPVRVPIDRWRTVVSDEHWPIPAGQDWIIRADVFATALRWRLGEAHAHELLGAVLLWGYGGRGYAQARARVMYGSDPTGAKLGHNLEQLADEATASEDALGRAYRLFQRQSPTHIEGLGPSFFTKLLYFVGYRRGSGSVQPLILDQYVRAALPPDVFRNEDGIPFSQQTPPSQIWLNYLRWARRQATLLNVEPEAVEMRYFQLGRH